MEIQEREFWQRHLQAAEAPRENAFLRLMDEEGVALGRYEHRLDEGGRKVLAWIRQYHARWRSEGGPHPEVPSRYVECLDPFERFTRRKEGREYTKGQAEFLDWGHSETQRLRGLWVGAIERVLIGPGEDAGPGPAEDKPEDTVQFSWLEKAIALLIRDGSNPRSIRQYAKKVGVAHTTLSRNARWKTAWKIARAAVCKDVEDIPRGSKDSEGNLEATREEVCENCRQEPVHRTVTVAEEPMRLCEECARTHE